MQIPTDEQFEQYVNEGIEKIPPLYMENLKNVAIVIADEPTPSQRKKLKLRCNETLFGLYEGVPLNRRSDGINTLVPDKITIFKVPISAYSSSIEALKNQVAKTVWHEIAHYYGLNHAQIHKLEGRA